MEITAEASVDDLSLLKTGLQSEIQELDQTASDQIHVLSSHINQTSRTSKLRI
ncbi:hypothetical protein ACLSYN_10485 [Avibacterium avium]|uniref:hypothetical protein n=1 Tax=Avibacterium avium TaxID=751 RepID=UPI003BF8E1AC